MFSFSAAYTGAYLDYEKDPVTGIVSPVLKDVNPTGETFSGSNVIEMNAFNNAPELEANTFNGSTEINNTFQNLDSTGNKYNGSVDIDLKGNGNMTSTVDTFQNASVDASMSTVTFDSPTFNGNTTLQANSLTLGSVPQMDELINLTKYIVDQLVLTAHLIGYNHSSDTVNYFDVTSPTGNTIRINLNTMQYAALQFQNGNFSLVTKFLTPRYGNFRVNLLCWFTGLYESFKALGDGLMYLYNYIVGSANYPIYEFTIDSTGESYSIIKNTQQSTWRNVILNRINIIINILDFWFHRFYEWYYPLDNVLPEYWRYYNTDTAEQEEIGLAGLMYNISWYLGQMYVLQSGSDALDNMTTQVEAVGQTLSQAEQKENEVISSISSGINNFAPDLSEIGAFKALSWSSNYLQQIFVALGTYGTVILVGLLLGVCMQFIGYFKYK